MEQRELRCVGSLRCVKICTVCYCCVVNTVWYIVSYDWHYGSTIYNCKYIGSIFRCLSNIMSCILCSTFIYLNMQSFWITLSSILVFSCCGCKISGVVLSCRRLVSYCPLIWTACLCMSSSQLHSRILISAVMLLRLNTLFFHSLSAIFTFLVA